MTAKPNPATSLQKHPGKAGRAGKRRCWPGSPATRLCPRVNIAQDRVAFCVNAGTLRVRQDAPEEGAVGVGLDRRQRRKVVHQRCARHHPPDHQVGAVQVRRRRRGDCKPYSKDYKPYSGTRIAYAVNGELGAWSPTSIAAYRHHLPSAELTLSKSCTGAVVVTNPAADPAAE